MEAFAFRYFYFSKIDANDSHSHKAVKKVPFCAPNRLYLLWHVNAGPPSETSKQKSSFRCSERSALTWLYCCCFFVVVVVDVGVTEDGNQNARVWLVVCMYFSVKVPVRWDLAADGSLFVHVTNFIYFRFCPFEWAEIRFLLLVLGQRKLPACFVVWLRERVFYSWRRWWIATWKNHASPSRTGGGTCKCLGGRIVFQLWGF